MYWIAVILIGIVLFSLAYAASSGAPWVPTWKRDIQRIKRLLQLKEGETFYELGCGDGRVTIALAIDSKAEGIGVELSVAQWLIAVLRKGIQRAKTVHFRWANVFHVDYRDADAIYLFLLPETYEKLRPKLEAELKPGARVVSYVWPIPGWDAQEIDEEEGSPKLYLYKR